MTISGHCRNLTFPAASLVDRPSGKDAQSACAPPHAPRRTSVSVRVGNGGSHGHLFDRRHHPGGEHGVEAVERFSATRTARIPGGTRRIRIASPSAGPPGAPSSSTWNSPASHAATGCRVVRRGDASRHPTPFRPPHLHDTPSPDLIPAVRALSRTDRCVFVCPRRIRMLRTSPDPQEVQSRPAQTLHHCRRRGLVAVGHLSAAARRSSSVWTSTAGCTSFCE